MRRSLVGKAPLLTFITFLAFALRLARLDFQPLWWDEGWTVYFTTSDIPSMVARTAVDIHPPFYYLALHLWILLAGPTPFAIRFLSLMVGTLTVPLLFLLARRLFNPWVGLLSATIIASAPFHIYYSQEARMYGLVTFLGVLSTYFAWRIWKGDGSLGLWVGYISATGLAIYTQYYAAFLPLAQTLFLLVRRRDIIPRWLAAQVSLLLIYLPWLLFAGGKLIDYVGTKLVKEADLPLGFVPYMGRHLAAFGIGHLPPGSPLVWLSVIPLFLAILGVGSRGVSRRDEDKGYLYFLLLGLFTPLFLGFLINLRFPFQTTGVERLLLFTAPALYILIALGLYALRRRKALLYLAGFALLAASAASLFGFYTTPRYPQDDYRPLMARLQALARPEDVIVAVHPWQIGYMRSCLHGEIPSLYLTPKEEFDVTQERWASDPQLMTQELDLLLSQHPRLWFPSHQALGRMLENEIEEHLIKSHYPILAEWYSKSTKLTAYAGETSLVTEDIPLDFGGKLLLQSYGVNKEPVEAAFGVVRVHLLWEKIAGFQEGYRVALRLTDEEGYVWAAQDSEPMSGLRSFSELPVGGRMEDRHSLLVPAGTPPGGYEVRLSIYREATEAPLGVASLGSVGVIPSSRQPPVEALPIQHPLQAEFGGRLRLLGYSLGGGPYSTGQEVEATLFWQAMREMGEDYLVSLQLKDGSGRVWASQEAGPVCGRYPTHRWPSGGLVRDPHRILIPADTPAGDYSLTISLHSPDGHPLTTGRWLSVRDELTLCALTVEGRPHSMTPPSAIQHPLPSRLGEGVLLLGYDLDSTQAPPGGTLHLTLYWQALAPMETSYTVFTHLIDDQGYIWGQKDNIPGDWSLPTTGWIEGEYITDEYEIPVKENAPLGDYLIDIGMYDASTGTRLPIFDEGGREIGDRLLLETPIRISP